MFTSREPKFKRGNILKKEMLAELKDYPRNFLKKYYGKYSNGVFTGTEITVKGDYIYVNEGIVKFDNLFFFLNQPIKIKYSDNNEEMMIKIKFKERTNKSDFKQCKGKVILDNNLQLQDDELELGRFKLREGARLKNSFKKFSDFSVEYNTLNLINVKYSAPEKHTLHPRILNKFAEILYSHSDVVRDIVFATECLNSKIVVRKLLINYITKKLDLKSEDYENREIFDFLRQILSGLSYSAKRDEKRTERQQIIVD